jgi:hypothetical protein
VQHFDGKKTCRNRSCDHCPEECMARRPPMRGAEAGPTSAEK